MAIQSPSSSAQGWMSNSTLNFPFNSPMTITGWVKTTSSPVAQNIVVTLANHILGYPNIACATRSSTASDYIVTVTTGDVKTTSLNTYVNAWTCFYIGSADFQVGRECRNGNGFYNTLTYTSTQTATMTRLVLFGQGTNHTYNNIAEICLWNVKLTSTEFTDICNGINPLYHSRHANVVAYYPLRSDFTGYGTGPVALSAISGATPTWVAHPTVDALPIFCRGAAQQKYPTGRATAKNKDIGTAAGNTLQETAIATGLVYSRDYGVAEVFSVGEATAISKIVGIGDGIAGATGVATTQTPIDGYAVGETISCSGIATGKVKLRNTITCNIIVDAFASAYYHYDNLAIYWTNTGATSSGKVKIYADAFGSIYRNQAISTARSGAKGSIDFSISQPMSAEQISSNIVIRGNVAEYHAHQVGVATATLS